MFPVAILAGGLATRLRPITETIPKALVDVAGKPFILRQLAYLRKQGIRDIVLCIGYLGHMVRDLVGDGHQFEMNIRYSEDGPNLLGTGGALAKATPLLGNHFFVLYGDSFLPLDFGAVQRAFEMSEQPALMTVLRNQNQWDKSNVLFADGRLLEYNKHEPGAEMTYIDYGLSVVSESVLKRHPGAQSFDLADLYRGLSLQGKLAGLEVHERFYEIGSFAGLRAAEAYFLNEEGI